MENGTKVMALGKKGEIKGLIETKLSHTQYVHRIKVQLEGETFSRYYYPDDVKELKNENNSLNGK